MTEPLLLPAKEAFARLGVGRDSGYELVRQGRIQVLRIGRKILVPVAELDAFVERETGRESA
jgi:excisionase family DNA binding protein